MSANSKMASAVHIMCYLARKGGGALCTSDAIAHSLATNPVVIRKLLKLLENEGLVVMRQGRGGGVSLSREPESITLDLIYRAIKREEGVFVFREQVNPRCIIAKNIPAVLGPVFHDADDAVETSLRSANLAQLLKDMQ